MSGTRRCSPTPRLPDYDLRKPLIVAANGHAIAGGMELLRAGDLRVVASKTLLGLSEVKLGLIPAMGGTATLIRHMPRALAAEMLLTGNVISADRALAVVALSNARVWSGPDPRRALWPVVM